MHRYKPIKRRHHPDQAKSLSKALSRRNLILSGVGSLAAFAALGNSTLASATTPDHPNVSIIKRYYEAYGAGQIETIRSEIFAPNITWTIPGHHPLSGTKRGADNDPNDHVALINIKALCLLPSAITNKLFLRITNP